MAYDIDLGRVILARSLVQLDFAVEALPLLRQVGMTMQFDQALVEYLLRFVTQSEAVPSARMLVLWICREYSEEEERKEAFRHLDTIVDLATDETSPKASLAHLRRFVQRAKLRDAVAEVGQTLQTPGEESQVVAAMRRAADRYEALEPADDRNRLVLGANLKARLDEREKEDTRPRVQTPLRCLNLALNGGLRPESLVSVTASTDTGKSAWLTDMGYTAALRSDAAVLHVTVEDSMAEIESRYLARHSGVSRGVLDRPDRLGEHKAEVLEAFNGDFDRLRGRIEILDFSAAPRFERLLPEARKFRKRHPEGFMLILADGADEMLIDGRFETIWLRKAEVFRELRTRVAKDPKLQPCAVVATIQQGRQVGEKAPKAESVRGPFEASTLAHVELGLQDTGEAPGDKRKRAMRIHLLKNKLGG